MPTPEYNVFRMRDVAECLSIVSLDTQFPIANLIVYKSVRYGGLDGKLLLSDEWICPHCSNPKDDLVYICEGKDTVTLRENPTARPVVEYSKFRCPQCNSTVWFIHRWVQK